MKVYTHAQCQMGNATVFSIPVLRISKMLKFKIAYKKHSANLIYLRSTFI